MSLTIGGNVSLGMYPGGPSSLNLYDLHDVTITDPMTGQYLRYNSSTTDWSNSFLNQDIYNYFSSSVSGINGISFVPNSGSLTYTFGLSPTGVTAGTYTKVTVNLQGQVLAGQNPTTLSGYGITDALNIAGGSMTGNILMTTGSTITGLPTPVSATDAANKDYVDSIVNGTSWKAPAKVATTANITLSGLQTIDGYTTLSGDRVLVKNQTTATQNGIYSAVAGAWTRTTDADAGSEIAGSALFIQVGTTQANTQWINTNSTVIIGTTNIVYQQFGAAVTYSAGTGLLLTGTVFSNTGVLSATGTANQIAVSSSTGNVTFSLPSSLSGISSIAGPISITANSSSTALTVTQSGSGNSFVVQDSTDPDSTPFVIDTNGVLRIGPQVSSVGSSTLIQVNKDAGPVSVQLYSSSSASASDRSYINLSRSRGSQASPTSVVSGDSLGEIYVTGYDGTNLVGSVQLSMDSEGTVSTGVVPGRFTLRTADSTGTLTSRMTVDSTGAVGFPGIDPTSLVAINKPMTSSTSFGCAVNTTIASSVTSFAIGHLSSLTTQAASFTLTELRHYSTLQNAFGAGSTVTNQTGYFASATLIGATNNYGFYGNLASGTGRYNLYMNGTADNYMAGSLGIGSTPTAGINVFNAKPITGAVSSYGMLAQATVASDVTSSADIFRTNPGTQSTSFTLSLLSHFNAGQGAIGAGSVVTTQQGFNAGASLIGASNNYGFRGQLTAGTGRYNLYMDGTADNVFAGQTSLGGLQGAEGLRVVTTASAVNYVQIAGATSGNSPTISAQGAGTNLDLNFVPKGTGASKFTTLVATTFNGNTWTTGTGTLTIAAGKTLTCNNSITFAGTDSTTMTFPTTSATIARTDAANTFNGQQTVSNANIRISNAFALAGQNAAGTTYYQLISRNSSDKVSIDPDGFGTVFGGSIVATSFNGNTITTGTGTLTLGTGKTTTFNSTSTFTGTDAQTYTFPTTSATLARTDAANTFNGDNVLTGNLYMANNKGFVIRDSSAGSGFVAFVDASNAVTLFNQNSTTLQLGTAGLARMTIGGTGTISLGGATVGAESLRVTTVASAVNYINIDGNSAGSPPTISVKGTDSAINFDFRGKAASLRFMDASGAISFTISPTASSVNYVTAVGATTGNPAKLTSTGSDTNVGLIVSTQGAADISFFTGSSSYRQFAVLNTTSAVNYGTVTGGTAGNGVIISVAGSDTDIPIKFTPKGAGASVFIKSAAAAYNSLTVENTSSTGFAQHIFNIGSGGANGQANINYAPGLFFKLGPTANDTTTPIILCTNNGVTAVTVNTDKSVTFAGDLNSTGLTTLGTGASSLKSGIGTAFLAGQGEIYSTTAHSIGIGTTGAASLNMYTNSVKVVEMTSAGNFGIGATPATLLDVNGVGSMSRFGGASGSNKVMAYSGSSGVGIWQFSGTSRIFSTSSLVFSVGGTIGTGDPSGFTDNVLILNTTGISIGGLFDISAAAAGQIKFPATQNPSANANTLDDYAEGTWTPSIGGSATYTTQTGRYTKIGRQVSIICDLQINALGTGSANVISGLPFTCSGDTPIFVGYWNGAAVSAVTLNGYILNSGTTVTLTSLTAGSSTSVGGAVLTSSTRILFGATYYV